MKSIAELVADSPVFSGLDPEYLELIAGCGKNAGFAAGEYVFREGQAADSFYLLRRGRVALELFVPGRGQVTIETIDAGDVLGWSWFVPPYRWHFDARATELVRTVAFDGSCLRGKCIGDHALCFEMLQRFLPVIVGRLQSTRLRLLDLYGTRVAS